MIVVPAWTLGAGMIALGMILATYSGETDANDGPSDAAVNACGIFIMLGGIGVTWIGPYPEPASAWIAIGAALALTGAGSMTSWAGTDGRMTKMAAIAASAILLAVTLIVRASIDQFQ